MDYDYASFPIEVAPDDQGHDSIGFNSQCDQAGDIPPKHGDTHHSDNDQDTISMTQYKGSSNGNVILKNISHKGSIAPYTVREENLANFMRDYLPPVQLIPQEEEDSTVALNDQAELIR
eukprot:8976081-Ditylum_brightwellii.AAC.1